MKSRCYDNNRDETFCRTEKHSYNARQLDRRSEPQNAGFEQLPPYIVLTTLEGDLMSAHWKHIADFSSVRPNAMILVVAIF